MLQEKQEQRRKNRLWWYCKRHRTGGGGSACRGWTCKPYFWFKAVEWEHWKATTTWINATLQLESAIRKYNSVQTVLDNAVGIIYGKFDTINTYIDNILKDAPSKLQFSVRVTDADWPKIQTMFDNEHKWMTTQMQKHIREVNEISSDERKCSISSGSSASLVWSYSAWLSSFRSILTTTGRSNIMFPTWLVEFILGTTNPLTIGISTENQWVCLFCCQFW